MMVCVVVVVLVLKEVLEADAEVNELVASKELAGKGPPLYRHWSMGGGGGGKQKHGAWMTSTCFHFPIH